MAEELTTSKAEIFPKGVGDTHKSTTSSVEPPYRSDIEDHDPETVKFMKRHTIQKWADRAGNKDDLYKASNIKPSLENEKNSRLKGHGKKEKEVYEESEDLEELTGVHNKPNLYKYVSKAQDQHEKALKKPKKYPGVAAKTRTGILRAASRIKNNSLEEEELKEKKFDDLARKMSSGGDVDLAQAPNSAKDSGLSSKKKIFKNMAGGGGSLGSIQGTYSQRTRASRNKLEESVCPKCHKEHEEGGECGKKLLLGGKKLKENTLANQIAMFVLEHNKAARLEQMLEDKVGSDIHKVDMGHPDFTGGMHIGERPDAENQTEKKPTTGSSAKTRKLSKAQKSEVKVMEDHADPMPHLDSSKLPPKNKIPHIKKDPYQPQPELGDPNKKKSSK